MAKNRITFTDDFVLRDEKVGIGTTNPTSTLDVRGDLNVGSGTSSLIYNSSANRLGIGTTNPTENLTVVGTVLFKGTTQNPNLYIANNGYVGFGTTNPTADVEFKQSVRFSAIGATSTENINLSPYTEEAGALSFENADYETQHFSVTNSPSNILFAVNNEDADPYLQVTDAGITSIRDGEFLSFKGVAVGATESEVVTMFPYTEEGGALSFENVVGSYQHLSLTNEIGGDVFAVNDDDANPVLQVSNSGVIHSGITTIGLTTLTTSPLGFTTTTPVMSFELQDDTTLRFRVRGTDGTVRTGIVTLA